ncbi:hypothetical protein PR202_ga05372 [Eleusine coracana subsp. coracana]|uniref:Cation efflux protein cytoplasmic domain-containing protein n=1 Tax=Eleusine coracana subsp. coracana TaxID=191504 RepID=A0AAV5BRI9_ELECO|nr:hypothetical protein PR202_ga04919 [Eleusine coracana subsp. coracana]GJM89207.1 hypothetical protein PR202_ga05372 [Eleusine coracana subsp. coracana]
MAAAGARGGGEGEELLLRAVEGGDGGSLCVGERPWRLNFDGFRRREAPQEKPERGLQDCLGVLAQGPGDVVAQYYQQQLEMLESFTEMDTLTDHGFLPGMTKGILVFASVMATLGLQIILESTRSLVSDGGEFRLTKEQEKWVIDIMLSVTLVKLLLVIYCRSFTNEIVKAYAQDHFFDVITNVIGLVAALLANYVQGWIDPVGAIILAIYTIRTWSMTVLENVHSLVGQSAPPEFLQKLTYLCWNHHKAVRHIDTVRAYTFGSHYFVEVDIVLPCDMPLREAHDIGEALQEKLEHLPEIERAFVHLDYEFTHQPEHARSHAT